MRRGVTVVAVIGLVLVAALAARRLTAWSPPSRAAARPYTVTLDRYLASTRRGGVFGSAGHWFCATRFLGATTSGSRVTAYAWALCEETRAKGDRIALGSGESLPVVVHLRSVGAHLQPVAFAEPGDAPNYESDVHRLFPSNVADWILGSAHQGDVKALEASVISQAKDSAPAT